MGGGFTLSASTTGTGETNEDGAADASTRMLFASEASAMGGPTLFASEQVSDRRATGVPVMFSSKEATDMGGMPGPVLFASKEATGSTVRHEWWSRARTSSPMMFASEATDTGGQKTFEPKKTADPNRFAFTSETSQQFGADPNRFAFASEASNQFAADPNRLAFASEASHQFAADPNRFALHPNPPTNSQLILIDLPFLRTPPTETHFMIKQ
jgi:hypothetical protein